MYLNETVDFYIKSTWHAMTRMYNNIANEQGISQAVGYVLIHVEKEGTPATKIAPLMGMEPTSLSRLLKKMEKMGFIYKKIDSNDKRIVRIFLTEKGVEKRKIAKETILAFNEKLKNIIGEEHIKSLIQSLKYINECALLEYENIE